MINKELINPKSIVVVGGSNNILKAGGSSLDNILKGTFSGDLYVVNAKEDLVQGVKSYRSVDDLPNVDMAVISIPAKVCLPVIDTLVNKKGVKAVIVFSAGFSEETPEGAELEKQLLDIVNKAGVSLVGPNCSGVINVHHQSMFTRPVPEMNVNGVDMVSSSGATATFIFESASRVGLRFNSVWSVGNTAQIGIEDVLQYWDEGFDPETSSKVKLVYAETLKAPDRFLKHVSSLRQKGCQVVAIKSGTTESGSRAASSHTGAITSSDSAVDALLRKAGVIRCYSRDELANVAAALTLPQLKGKKIAIISHAGGPAVILTDALSKVNIDVPEMPKEAAALLKPQLLPGSAVMNPIDILGTAAGRHLEIAIDHCIEHFKEIDGIAVIYGNSGVTDVAEAYNVLSKKIETSPIPIYPILPSVHTAAQEIKDFVDKGHVTFVDECNLADALGRIVACPAPATSQIENLDVDVPAIRQIIDSIEGDGYISPEDVRRLLKAAGIPNVEEFVSDNKEAVLNFAEQAGFPVVAKCVGPVHKSDVGGVVLNINSREQLGAEFDRLMQIKDATSVMVQPMLSGTELFIGATYEPTFGHVILCGLGGIFVEVLKDVSSGLAPLSFAEASSMIKSLRAYKIIEGVRGQKGLNEELFTEIIVRFSIMLRHAVEIKEMDINPLLANDKKVIAVDARIRIEK
ncbi:acyl-CoA synthetase (NDP forming) [Dysgonomonas sp. PH5-45]|uniref:acetate--CoA ligase family protein n=1 Tax=unclassified Dysgonomonas TaxID=2630389 RepID=UPI002474970B|nr:MULTISPECIES: acetate--CoA ligase [unclassified Dysgonomonas]MDH6355337.1 acyl-CoA synthetase (NDP forming) [Dysgonomonas sp. PH5-45]MDH6388235.1 acyl-CoA synthetase (NDP forming) [Dysgonomonas sp. PH5-37]